MRGWVRLEGPAGAEVLLLLLLLSCMLTFPAAQQHQLISPELECSQIRQKNHPVALGNYMHGFVFGAMKLSLVLLSVWVHCKVQIHS